MSSPDPALRITPAVHRAAHRLALHIAALRHLRASQGEAHIPAQLAAEGPATVAKLHRTSAHRRSTLTSILDRLVARGLVRRDPSQSDRRTFVVSLTPRGRLGGAGTLRELDRIERQIRLHLTATDLRSFERVVAELEQLLAARSASAHLPVRRMRKR
jgi:DNA-binding MarR family transcriptional regulator